MSGASIIGLMLVFALLFGGLVWLRRLLVACRPGRVLILYRASTQQSIPSEVAKYRVIYPGQRALQSPLGGVVSVLETKARKSAFQVQEAHTLDDDMILQLDLSATLQVADTPPAVHRAIRRFLGRSAAEIDAAVIEIIERTMRQQMRDISADDILPKPKRLAQSVLDECKPILDADGIDLQHLEIRKIAVSN